MAEPGVERVTRWVGDSERHRRGDQLRAVVPEDAAAEGAQIERQKGGCEAGGGRHVPLLRGAPVGHLHGILAAGTKAAIDSLAPGVKKLTKLGAPNAFIPTILVDCSMWALTCAPLLGVDWLLCASSIVRRSPNSIRRAWYRGKR